VNIQYVTVKDGRINPFQLVLCVAAAAAYFLVATPFAMYIAWRSR
jgi:hypothetical protein